MKNFSVTLAALGALAFAAPALAREGFNRESAARFAETATVAAPPMERALHVAERLRARLIVNPVSNLDTAAPGANAALDRAFRTCCTAAHVSWFMRGASVRATDTGDGMTVIGYHNPLVDGWLLTAWAATATEPRLIYASLVQGDANGETYWRDTEASDFAQSLVSATMRSRQRLRVTDLINAAPEAAQSLRNRTDDWMESIETWRSDPSRVAIARQAQQALVDPRRHRFGTEALTPARLETIRLDVRRSMAPLAAFRAGDLDVLIMNSPLRPSLLIFAEAAQAESGSRAMRLYAINLDNTAATEARP